MIIIRKAHQAEASPQPFDFPLRAVDLFDIPREGARGRLAQKK